MYFYFTVSSLCLYSLVEKWGLASAEKRKLPCPLRADVIHLLALGAFFCWDPHSLSSLHSPAPLPSRLQEISPTSPAVWPWTPLFDPSCGSWQISKMGISGTERKKDQSLPFLTPVLPETHGSCNKRSSLGTWIHTSRNNNLLGKNCTKLRAKVLLLSVPVCKSTAIQFQVLAEDPEILGELGGTGEIKGLGNKGKQV